MAHVDYALVLDGAVVNVIVIDDQDAETIAHFAEVYEAVVPLAAGKHGVTIHPTAGRQGGPGIGWTYNTKAKRFAPPPTPDPPVEIPPPGG